MCASTWPGDDILMNEKTIRNESNALCDVCGWLAVVTGTGDGMLASARGGFVATRVCKTDQGMEIDTKFRKNPKSLSVHPHPRGPLPAVSELLQGPYLRLF